MAVLAHHAIPSTPLRFRFSEAVNNSSKESSGTLVSMFALAKPKCLIKKNQFRIINIHPMPVPAK
jgi:hypothetical protein